jgi:uracil phosphoribosyltransferase
MIHILHDNVSVASVFLSELRDANIQKDPLRFRRNLERLGEIMAYELSKTLNYSNAEVITPLGVAETQLPSEQPIVATILRAGLPVHQGVLNYFDRADNAFISAYRKHHKDGSFEIKVEYLSAPSIEGRVVILCDPMLATGQSMYLAYKALLSHGKPAHVHIVSVIASKEGLEYTRSRFPENTHIWIGAVDDELTAKSYIVPGLGDAGDLAYGIKL